MKYLISALLLLVAGCANTNVMTPSSDKTAAIEKPLLIIWQPDSTAEIRLDGKRFIGKWSESRCFTPQCRGEFRNVQQIHRQQIRRGSSELEAKDKSRLYCNWVSHHQEVIGTCQTDDGKKFALKAA